MAWATIKIRAMQGAIDSNDRGNRTEHIFLIGRKSTHRGHKGIIGGGAQNATKNPDSDSGRGWTVIIIICNSEQEQSKKKERRKEGKK